MAVAVFPAAMDDKKHLFGNKPEQKTPQRKRGLLQGNK